jgi:hypothetical protein
MRSQNHRTQFGGKRNARPKSPDTAWWKTQREAKLTGHSLEKPATRGQNHRTQFGGNATRGQNHRTEFNGKRHARPKSPDTV